ncbi:MAG: alpha/beta hydrolase [Bacteroidota bacterium]
MRIKKRYIVLAVLFVGFIFLSRMDFLTMRDKPEEVMEEMKTLGVDDLSFQSYEIAGREMHYMHTGKEGKPLLILIHGTPGSATVYNNYLADSTLSTYFQMAAVDRPGLGYSSFGETERSLQLQSACIKPIIDRHPTDKVIILGHSYGGPVVARMAMDYPGLIDGMVIVAGSVSPALEPREWWRAPIDLPLVRQLLPPALRVSNQEIKALYDELMIMESESMWDKITCPTLVYQGTKDNLVPMGNAGYIDSMVTNSPMKDIVYIEEGDHFILWSRMDEIVASTVDLLGYMMDSTETVDRDVEEVSVED